MIAHIRTQPTKSSEDFRKMAACDRGLRLLLTVVIKTPPDYPNVWPIARAAERVRRGRSMLAMIDRAVVRSHPRPEPAMTSHRQIEANRRNATNSTGPRTTRGMAVVALNAVQHGLLSRQAVIQGESEAELIDLGKRLRGQLAPVGELELLLVDRIISTAWRLRRAIALETLLFDTERGDSSPYGLSSTSAIATGCSCSRATSLPLSMQEVVSRGVLFVPARRGPRDPSATIDPKHVPRADVNPDAPYDLKSKEHETWWDCPSNYFSANAHFFNDPNYVTRNNCYCFAGNHLANVRYALPGRRGGRPATSITCGGVIDGLRADGWKDGCQTNGLTIVLVIWPNVDYHFYRLVTGRPYWWWGHKPGGTPAKYTDDCGTCHLPISGSGLRAEQHLSRRLYRLLRLLLPGQRDSVRGLACSRDRRAAITVSFFVTRAFLGLVCLVVGMLAGGIGSQHGAENGSACRSRTRHILRQTKPDVDSDGSRGRQVCEAVGAVIGNFGRGTIGQSRISWAHRPGDAGSAHAIDPHTSRRYSHLKRRNDPCLRQRSRA